MSWVGASVVKLLARWTAYHYHLSSNLVVGISEGCFVFEYASLPLQAHLAYQLGGFRLTKWVTNSSNVLEWIPI